MQSKYVEFMEVCSGCTTDDSSAQSASIILEKHPSNQVVLQDALKERVSMHYLVH